MPNTDRPDLSALWPLLPPWIKWVAMAESGYWYGYMREPQTIRYSFGSCFIPKEYAPKWRGDWRKSLTRRPKDS